MPILFGQTPPPNDVNVTPFQVQLQLAKVQHIPRALLMPACPFAPLQVLWNGNPLLPQQWVAVAMVFGGLLASSVVKSRRHRHHNLPKKAV